MEGEENEREDASHLPYDDRRHSRSVILNGSPTKEVPTQGPNDNSPSQMASLTASQMASQMTDMTPYDLQSGETYTMSTLVVPASFVAMTTTQEFEERKAEEKKAKEDEQRLQEEAEEAEDLKLKEEERRIAEAEAEQLDYSHLKPDDADAMDLELFHSIRGIPATFTAGIVDRSTLATMTAKDLKSLCSTYYFLVLNGKGIQVKKGVSTNSTKKGGETGKILLRKRCVAYNYWRYLKAKGLGPDKNSRPWGGVSEFTPNEYARLVIVYTHEDNYELLLLTAQKSTRDELDVCNGNPGQHAHDQLCKSYNNFSDFKPLNEFADEDGELGGLDPNDPTIRIRGPHATKAVWSALRSSFYHVHKNWQASGKMDPDSFPDFMSDAWHLLYLWRKFHQRPEMINLISRSVHQDAIVDSLDYETDKIAERAEAQIGNAPRRNVPVKSIRITRIAATPSSTSLVTEGNVTEGTTSAKVKRELKRNPSSSWMDSFSTNLANVLKTDSENQDKTVSLRAERRKCWDQLDKFREQLELATSTSHRRLIQERLDDEKESLGIMARKLKVLEALEKEQEKELEPAKKSKRNNKKKERAVREDISVSSGSSTSSSSSSVTDSNSSGGDQRDPSTVAAGKKAKAKTTGLALRKHN